MLAFTGILATLCIILTGCATKESEVRVTEKTTDVDAIRYLAYYPGDITKDHFGRDLYFNKEGFMLLIPRFNTLQKLQMKSERKGDSLNE